ncbi:Na+/galactose cotransporter, partial [Microbacterium sp. KNMS]
GLVSGTVAAVVLWSSSTFFHVFTLPGQGLAFLSAATAFVVDILVSVVVTQFTTPKPVHELKGLVYSETPKTDLVDPD